MRAAAVLLLLAAAPVPAQTSGQDWAQTARYRADNIARAAADRYPRVVFMGDSITELWAEEPAFVEDSSRAGRGISGQTAPQMLVRFRADVIALKPKAVHIMAGTNDVAGNTGPESDADIEGYIASMAELAAANGIRVVLASIPPAAAFPWRRGLDPVPRIEALNAWIKTYAAAKHFGYVDYWPVLAAPNGAMKREYSADGVHPNAAGFAAMEPLTQAAVGRALQP